MGTKDDVILYILNVDIKVKLLRGFVSRVIYNNVATW